MTSYLILRANSNTDTYVIVGEVDGVTGETALRTYLKSLDEGNALAEGRFATVPERSWKPVEVETVRQPRTLFRKIG